MSGESFDPNKPQAGTNYRIVWDDAAKDYRIESGPAPKRPYTPTIPVQRKPTTAESVAALSDTLEKHLSGDATGRPRKPRVARTIRLPEKTPDRHRRPVLWFVVCLAAFFYLLGQWKSPPHVETLAQPTALTRK